MRFFLLPFPLNAFLRLFHHWQRRFAGYNPLTFLPIPCSTVCFIPLPSSIPLLFMTPLDALFLSLCNGRLHMLPSLHCIICVIHYPSPFLLFLSPMFILPLSSHLISVSLSLIWFPHTPTQLGYPYHPNYPYSLTTTCSLYRGRPILHASPRFS